MYVVVCLRVPFPFIIVACVYVCLRTHVSTTTRQTVELRAVDILLLEPTQKEGERKGLGENVKRSIGQYHYYRSYILYQCIIIISLVAFSFHH